MEEDRGLWIDDWVGDLEVEIGLWPGGGDCSRGDGTVNGIEGGGGSLRDVGGEGKEEFVQVGLRIDVAEIFKDTEFVPGSGEGGGGDVVERFDAAGRDCYVTD